jgi:kinesin family member 11
MLQTRPSFLPLTVSLQSGTWLTKVHGIKFPFSEDNFLLVSGSLKLDHDAFANIGSILTPCHGEMRELKGGHQSKVVEITENTGKCLEEEYLVSSHEKATVFFREYEKQQLGLLSLNLPLTKLPPAKSSQTLQVDEPSCSTPRRRQIDLPSVESIEELRTPDYNELLKSFRETRGSWKQANRDMRHFSEVQEPASPSVRDSRVPLVARN